MFAPLWLRHLRHRFIGHLARSSGRGNPSRATRQRFRPFLEPLEDRLAPSADSVQVVAASLSTTFSESPQNVPLTATVTDTTTPSTKVNEGKVQFTVVNSSGTTIGTAATGTVTSNGQASVSYSLPAFTLVGGLTIDVSYSDSAGTFTDNGQDTSGTLTVNPAPTTTSASSAQTPFRTSAQNLTLNAIVTSNGAPVNEGQVQFSVRDSSGNTIGTSATGSVTSSGQASVSYGLPAYTLVGSYTIDVSYSDFVGNFASSSDASQLLTVSTAGPTNLGLNTISIVPNPSNSTARLTLTANVSNPAGVVSEGNVAFTVDGVVGQGNVVNGLASVQLVVPILDVVGTANVTLSYSDNAGTANFANGRAFALLSGNLWSELLPTSMAYSADGSEQMTVDLPGQSQLGYGYAASGLLTQIKVASFSLPVTYSNVSGDELVTIDGAPWQLNYFNPTGQYQGIATLTLNGDGSNSWIIFNSKGQIVGAAPST